MEEHGPEVASGQPRNYLTFGASDPPPTTERPLPDEPQVRRFVIDGDIVVERSERPAQNVQPRYRAVRGASLSSWTRGLTAAPSALAVALPPDTAKPALAVYIASWKVLPLGAVASANTG